MRKCSVCGYESQDGVRYCIECGERVGSSFIAKYIVRRNLPPEFSSQDLHKRLMRSLEETGYRIACPGPPIRAIRGTKSTVDGGVLVNVLKSLWDTSERTVFALDIKHSVIVFLNASEIQFVFRIGESIIEISLLEQRDEIAFEKMVDEVMERVIDSWHRKSVSVELKAKISNWVSIYHDVSGAFREPYRHSDSFSRPTVKGQPVAEPGQPQKNTTQPLFHLFSRVDLGPRIPQDDSVRVLVRQALAPWLYDVSS